MAIVGLAFILIGVFGIIVGMKMYDWWERGDE